MYYMNYIILYYNRLCYVIVELIFTIGNVSTWKTNDLSQAIQIVPSIALTLINTVAPDKLKIRF